VAATGLRCITTRNFPRSIVRVIHIVFDERRRMSSNRSGRTCYSSTEAMARVAWSCVAYLQAPVGRDYFTTGSGRCRARGTL